MKAIFSVSPQSAPVEVEFKDWRGTLIDVGSKIIYATGSSSSVEVVEAEVVSITPVTDSHRTTSAAIHDKWMQANGFDQDRFDKMLSNLNLCYKLKVKRTNKPGGFSSWDKPDKLIHLKEVQRVTVIG